MNMIELCYVSSANDRYSDETLLSLLRKARAHNASEKISGLLLYDGIGTFIQALEGEESAVKNLFAKIKRDEMHKRVNVLGIKNITSRSFSDWHMGFRFIDNQHMSPQELAKIEGFSQFLECSDEEKIAQANDGFALKMLNYFRKVALEEKLTLQDI